MVFCGEEDELGEALDRVGWFGGEAGAKGLSDVVELLDEQVRDGVCRQGLGGRKGFGDAGCGCG